MTGVYNVRNYVRFGLLDREQTTFAHLFKKAGYATCVAGKWQLGSEPDSAQHFGFDESCLWQHTRRRTREGGFDSRHSNPSIDVNGREVDYREGEYGPDVVSDFACDFIERHRDKPFLLYYPMILPHCPFVPTPDSADWDPKDPGSRLYKGKPKYFADMVAYTDKMVGKIVAKLEEVGLSERTLVLFLGDNGTDRPIVSMLNGREVAGGKGQTTDAGTHVPMIAYWPGTISSGQVRTDLVDTTDFLPTICAAAGVEVPDDLAIDGRAIDGRSFLPQLLGKKGDPRPWIYCWYSKQGQPAQARQFARNERFKLYASGRLHDVANDPLEQNDLSGKTLDDEAARARAMLQDVLDQYKNARPERLRGRNGRLASPSDAPLSILK